ncbi:FtsW/RodA/SpoVE family cell cycle protein [Caldicoprobacter algeriensis]|uniref:FtsW/RodA/SpoVE family cell cycle protein n=1 Tax=Caldicoprobacter algeriensis TaxID=699281 RepID=UPI00207A57D8|nr:FtsW/RodA/SpoVE family cell cycle protein [Caldicoprobacter algeriensis]MCM8900699.1 FtsW/RodA/SpoVE family cell cycle protein [Caldicoprobacter algeriensis]
MPAKQYEILALTMRYWFVLLILYIFVRSLVSTVRYLSNVKATAEESTGNIPFVLVLFALTAFVLLSLNGELDVLTLLMGILVCSTFLFQYLLLCYLFGGIDRYLLLMVDTLCIVGFIMLQRLQPALAFRQVEWFGLGSIFLLLTILYVKFFKHWDKLNYPLMIIGLGVLILTLAIGKEIGGAKNWIQIWKYNVQPSEFVKIILVFVLSADLKTNKNRLRRLPVLLFTAFVILLVVLQKDLGAAFLYFCLFVFLYYIATSDWLIAAGASFLASLGAFISYHLFGHVRTRIAAWRNPWADVENKGYQIAQSLIAIASGGWVGLGLGLGSPHVIPASKTDFIFAAICEEMGILTGVSIIGLYLLIMVRGVAIALKARKPGDTLLTMGATISLAIQSFTIIGGVVKLIPLTGVTMPFVSYGGSSMLVSFGLLGIVQGIAIKNSQRKQDKDAQQHYEEDEGCDEQEED